jgi:hypothetical protein
MTLVNKVTSIEGVIKYPVWRALISDKTIRRKDLTLFYINLKLTFQCDPIMCAAWG